MYEFKGNLRSNIVRVPDVIKTCSGIRILGKTIRSLLFSTDIAVIKNCNADAVIAVYPFTPQPVISQAIIQASDLPVFCGVGGGLTTGERLMEIAIHADFQGAIGVVVNKPTSNEPISMLKTKLEIPVVVTVVDENEDFAGRIAAGADIFNVSGALRTPDIIRRIRALSDTIPIIATGGKTDNDIRLVIEAGANAITYTPPSTAELFKKIMLRYRNGQDYTAD